MSPFTLFLSDASPEYCLACLCVCCAAVLYVPAIETIQQEQCYICTAADCAAVSEAATSLIIIATGLTLMDTHRPREFSHACYSIISTFISFVGLLTYCI